MLKLVCFIFLCCIACGLKSMDSGTAGLDMTTTTTSGSVSNSRIPAK